MEELQNLFRFIRVRVDKATMKQIDALYVEFLESLKNMDADDSLTKYLMKSNKKFSKLLGL